MTLRFIVFESWRYVTGMSLWVASIHYVSIVVCQVIKEDLCPGDEPPNPFGTLRILLSKMMPSLL